MVRTITNETISWNRFNETFEYSDRSTEPNENGDYTQITISASETGLDSSIYSYNVNDQYFYQFITG